MTRLFDIVLAGTALLVLLPILIVVALLVKLTSRGPVFFHGERVGKGGQPFRILKFRTMFNQSRSGPLVTTADDGRVTSFGRFLRDSKIDELPELWNVVVGDMAVVGPRPEDPYYVSLYSPDQRAILRHRPGLTSPASIAYRNEESLLRGENWERQYVEEIMPAKLRVDSEYMATRNLATDLRVIARTVVALLDHR